MSHYPVETRTTTLPPAGWGSPEVSAPDARTVEARLSALASIVEWVARIASQSEDIANRIVGSRPEKEGNTGRPSPVPNGLPDTLALLHENIGAHLSRIDVALSRTREALG